jgi:hypothetical protein
MTLAALCAGTSMLRAATTLTFTPSSLTFPVTTTGITSAAVSTTVKNTGATAASITSVAITGNDPGDFAISTNTCPSSLTAGTTCTVSVTFKPTVAGIREATLTFTDNATGSPQSVPLQGTAQSATQGIAFFPTALAFPATTVGVASSSISTTVTNYGATTVSITGVHLQGTNIPDFSISGNSCSTLTQGAACTVSVSFTPLAAGVRQAGLLFTDTAPGSPQNVPVLGTGQSATQNISVAPADASFGTENIGAVTSAIYIGFTNAGTAAVTMTSYAITGTNAPDFAISSNGCPTPGGLLNANATCYIYVTFTPSAAGVRSASLSVADSAAGSPQTATLYGVGQAVANSLSFSRGTMDLGVEPIGTTSGQTYVAVQNTGTTPVTFTSVALGGADAGDFAITSAGCTGALAPLAYCYEYVDFKPVAAGQRTATLNFTDSATGSPQAINVEGTGETQTEALAFSYLDYGFGSFVVGTTSSTFYVGVTNTGDDPVTFTSIATAGTNPADFTITSDGCPVSPATLSPGGTCYVYTDFSPAAAGVRSATLQFTDSATGSPQTVGLGGLGLAPSQIVSFSAPSLVFPGTTVGSSSATQSVTLTNTGDQAVTFTSATITGASSSSYTVSSNGCATLQSNQTCNISVYSDPQATGVLTASLSVADTASGSPQTLPLAGDGEPSSPKLSASVTDVNFGYGVTGVTSAATQITMTNLSASPVTVTFLNAGPNSADFVVTANTCTGTLAGNASCTLKAAFDAVSLGLRTTALRFTVSSVAQDVLLSGVGSSASQLLTLQSSMDFGLATVGSSSHPTPINIQNTGAVPVNITGYSFAGADPTDFAFAYTTCGAILAPEVICDVYVVFTPTAGGERTASLRVADSASGSPQSVALSGVGQSSVLSLSVPAAVDLGSTVSGTPVNANVSIFNNGTSTVTITKAAITGTNASDFAVTNVPCATITPESSCSIQVTFNPTAAGVRTATLKITDNATGSPQSVTLVGVAQASAATLEMASAIAFPAQLVATYSNQNLIVTNTGTLAVTVGTISISGANASDFTVTDVCPTIAAGASCYFPVAFLPTAAGLRTATLKIADSATGSPQTIILTGYGLAANAALSIPQALAFPAITTGSYLVESIPIYNVGDITVLFTSVTVSGANATDFQVFGSCAQLNPGGGCTIYVAFTPSSAGTRTASLQFADNATGSPQSVTLTGIGQGKTASGSLTPSTLTFAAQTVGTQSGTQTIYLTNTGAAPLTVSGVATSGTNPQDFQVYYSTCAGVTLSQNAYCYIQITFTPTATGARTATVSVTDNGTGGKQSATLNGTGQ